jgi:arsenite methyltransferase
MTDEAKQVLLVLADISGYTSFMVSHEKALRHSQTIIGALLEATMHEVRAPLRVSEIQGDALFLYAERPRQGWSEDRETILDSLPRLFEAFARRSTEIKSYSICKCAACSNMGALRLKVIVHSGEALFNQVGEFAVLSGVDVIKLHRLAKNSVEGREYVLLSEDAYRALQPPPDMRMEEGVEHYDVGTIRTFTYRPPPSTPIGPDELRQDVSDANVAVRILRDEIRREYTDVAAEPERGYHFNTGLDAARAIGYDEDLLEGIPDIAVESFAGTGNPFSLGEIGQGDRVLDVGSGSGTDSLIAARMTGPTGQVLGVEMTPAMLEKARTAASEAGLEHVEFHEGYAEALPVPDAWADVIISNGVLNLAPDKSRVLAEFNRVLKPGGRLHVGDILVEKAVPVGARGNTDLWTA